MRQQDRRGPDYQDRHGAAAALLDTIGCTFRHGFFDQRPATRAWQGNLFIGSLKFAYLDRIELAAPYSGKAVRESKLISEVGERIRDVRQGPDGLLYVLTDTATES